MSASIIIIIIELGPVSEIAKTFLLLVLISRKQEI